ncbi:tRNA dihydrouridine synthase DusB [Entomomonas asaccharolytica]|uniref:tRNA-dihydrouridine synthase B n=1 Tax=Entomomonas asaccharolytica TaxID=2785331 RepID=A0A974RZH1_9GAMM|nr:tRNA dihydrouridine synthase DusB [Entomomonas asaccharolytica]QQP87064.1 tRNA dihydrouridine synthase DusB [Entomomonas asaccharolytica]
MTATFPRIGCYQLDGRLILAPMAGITDRPQRMLCRRFGAALAVSEMVTSDTRLWKSNKSKHRLPHQDDLEPRAIQIAGTDPEQMAHAAKANVALGAQIIDINMGCPAKKVCNKAAGSALMKDEKLVEGILQAVVKAVNVPITLKMRTGWDSSTKNAITVAKIAEQSGIKAIAIHGRTRADLYTGAAEYDTIAEIKQQVSLPIFANGDITSPEKAQFVLNYTKADALLIGRAAQGNPWLFREINYFLETGQHYSSPTFTERKQVMLEHLAALHTLYGEAMGMRIARKHMGWYLSYLPEGIVFKHQFNQLESAQEQYSYIKNIFTQ